MKKDNYHANRAQLEHMAIRQISLPINVQVNVHQERTLVFNLHLARNVKKVSTIRPKENKDVKNAHLEQHL